MYHTKAFKGFYNGIPYDSELEGTWYSFFDKLGISYTVPKSSQGFRGCIPDLIINNQIIAEIKPIDYRNAEKKTFWLANLVQKFNRYREIPEQQDKAQLILGNGLNISDISEQGFKPIGYLRKADCHAFHAIAVNYYGEFVSFYGESQNMIKAEKLLKLWQQSENDVKCDRRLKEAFGYLLEL